MTMQMSKQQINGATLAAWAVPYYMLGIGAVDDGADPMPSRGWCTWPHVASRSLQPDRDTARQRRPPAKQADADMARRRDDDGPHDTDRAEQQQ